MIGLQVVDRI